MNDIASAGGGGLLVGGDLLRAVEVAFNRDDGQIGPLSRILVGKAIIVVGKSISVGHCAVATYTTEKFEKGLVWQVQETTLIEEATLRIVSVLL